MPRDDIGRQTIGGTLRLAPIGIVIGLVLSFMVARLIASLLFGTSPTGSSRSKG